MKRAVLLALLLGGCASEPMTDEQRQFAMQYLLAQQAHPPQPYVLPMPQQPQPYMVPIPHQTNCASTVNGQIINTTCN